MIYSKVIDVKRVNNSINCYTKDKILKINAEEQQYTKIEEIFSELLFFNNELKINDKTLLSDLIKNDLVGFLNKENIPVIHIINYLNIVLNKNISNIHRTFDCDFFMSDIQNTSGLIIILLISSHQITDKEIQFSHILSQNHFIIPIIETNTKLHIGPVLHKTNEACLECIRTKESLKNYKYIRIDENEIHNLLYPAKIYTILQNYNTNMVLSYDKKQKIFYYTTFIPYPLCKSCNNKDHINILPLDIKINNIIFKKFETGYRLSKPGDQFKKLEYLIGDYGISNGIFETVDRDTNKYFYTYHGRILYKTNQEQNIFSAGKGLSKDQAKMSAFGEAMERYLGAWINGHHLIKGSYLELKDSNAVDPKLFGYPMGKFCWPKNGYQDDKCYEWINGFNLTLQKNCYIPANLVFFPYEPDNNELIFSVQTTTGLAGGGCLEEAIFQGLFEIIERDAYWFIMRTNFESFDYVPVKKNLELLHYLQENGIKIHLKNITNDLEIPVIHALAEQIDGGSPAFSHGSGAHCNIDIASTRAITETIQIREDLKLYLKNLCFFKNIQSDPHYLWCFSKNIELVSHLMQKNNYKNENKCKLNTLKKIIDLLEKKGFQVIAINLSREDIPYTVVRVLVTGIGITDSYYLTNINRFTDIAKYFQINDKNLIKYKGVIFS